LASITQQHWRELWTGLKYGDSGTNLTNTVTLPWFNVGALLNSINMEQPTASMNTVAIPSFNVGA